MSKESENEDYTQLWHYELWFRGKKNGSVFFSHRSEEPMMNIFGFAQKHGLLTRSYDVNALAYAGCLTMDEEGYHSEWNAFLIGFHRDEDFHGREMCEDNEIIDTEWDDCPPQVVRVSFEV